MGALSLAIHGLCIVKNEADVITHMLRAASLWCDHIYVFDNGSEDGTWDVVRELAVEIPAVVPFKQDATPFIDSLRGEILRHYRSRATAGDWWAVVDADEFYIDDPRAFLARVPDRYRAVWPQLYSYVFTDIDAYCYQHAPCSYAAETPLTKRLNHYVLGQYSELRFFRHNRGLTEIPALIGPIYPERIRMRHFGYRSPDQIDMRLATRREPMERGEFIHEKRSNWLPGGSAAAGPATASDMPLSWRERIVPHTECYVDLGVESLKPPLPWTPPESAQTQRRLTHGLRGRLRKAIARIVHLRAHDRQTVDAQGRAQ
jgi:hypothetical protein